MHRSWRSIAFLLVLLLAACTPSGEGERPPPLLLISIDGFRHDYLERADTPALDRLVEGGLHAGRLVHIFPTKTFPGHYTLVTGLYAENHGVVANSMWDPRREASFSLGDRDAVGDGFWYGGEPLWVTAEEQGLTAATYFWPGSEARIAGDRPTYWRPYRGETPHDERIDQVLAWLDLPDRERPDFLTLYFSSVDSTGHRYGPDAPEVIDEVERVDADLGRLLDGLEQRGRLGAMHLIVVSDHGMQAVSPERTIMLGDYLPLDRVHVSDWGPNAMIWAGDMDADAILAALEDLPHARAWPRSDIPEHLHFRDHPRVPDVLVSAEPGWMISNKAYLAGNDRYPLRGMHGWAPEVETMHGLFIAHGPAFPTGSRTDRVESVNVYELMCALLEIEPASNDGDRATWSGLLENWTMQAGGTHRYTED